MKHIERIVIIAFILTLLMAGVCFADDIIINDVNNAPQDPAAPVARDVVPMGVFISYMDVSGMNKEQVGAAIDQMVANLNSRQLTVHTTKGSTNMAVSGMNVVCKNREELINTAIGERGYGNLIQQYKQDKDIECNNRNLMPEYTIDGSLLASYLVAQIPDLETRAKNASLERKDNGEFVIIPAEDGFTIDYDGTYDQVIGALKNFDGQSLADVEVAGQAIAATYGTEVFENFGAVLGSWQTGYEAKGDSTSRAANIRLATSKINGTVLMPGEEFSFCTAVQPFTEEEGYMSAGTYIDGQTVDDLGGGVCQVSTTLYNAVIYSELQISFRSPHSKCVSYVDPGLDAMVYVKNNQDFRFANNTDHAIYIEGYVLPGYGGRASMETVGFTIYGTEYREPGRTIWYEGVVLSSKLPEGDVGPYLVKYDSSLDPYSPNPGKVVKYANVNKGAHQEMTAQVIKHIYMNGEEISAEVEPGSWVMYADELGVISIHPDSKIISLKYDPITLAITDIRYTNIKSGNKEESTTEKQTTEEATTEDETEDETSETETESETQETTEEPTNPPETEPTTETVYIEPTTEEPIEVETPAPTVEDTQPVEQTYEEPIITE